MADIKLNVSILVKCRYMKKIIWCNKMALCIWGEDIGNTLHHMGTMCCSRTWKYWKNLCCALLEIKCV